MDAHKILPSVKTTFASSIFCGSAARPFSEDSQDIPPERMEPPTPTYVQRAPTTAMFYLAFCTLCIPEKEKPDVPAWPGAFSSTFRSISPQVCPAPITTVWSSALYSNLSKADNEISTSLADEDPTPVLRTAQSRSEWVKKKSKSPRDEGVQGRAMILGFRSFWAAQVQLSLW